MVVVEEALHVLFVVRAAAGGVPRAGGLVGRRGGHVVFVAAVDAVAHDDDVRRVPVRVCPQPLRRHVLQVPADGVAEREAMRRPWRVVRAGLLQAQCGDEEVRVEAWVCPPG